MYTPAKRMAGAERADPAATGFGLAHNFVKLLRVYSPVGHTWLARHSRVFRPSRERAYSGFPLRPCPRDVEAQGGGTRRSGVPRQHGLPTCQSLPSLAASPNFGGGAVCAAAHSFRGTSAAQTSIGPAQGRVCTSRSPAAYMSRSVLLENLPTEVFGTSLMNVHRSGTCHFATRIAMNSRSSAAVAVASGRSTTEASGRSCHRSSGTPQTAASKTSGWDMRWFSSSTEEIHSPPDLMTSLARSVNTRNPSGEMVPTSPVRNQPSWN